MSVSVKFNEVELNAYIDVLQGFTPFTGADWQPSIDKFDGVKSGDRYNYQRYGAKEIPMPFRIRKNLNTKYDALEKILNVSEPKKLVFGNIPNRYFLAIPSGRLDFEQVWQSGSGVITWIVPDGLSHATTLKEFPAAVNDDGVLEATIVNNGSVEVPVNYEIQNKADNGFFGIVSENGVIQLGKADEADGTTESFSERLVDINDFISAADDHGTCYAQTDANTAGTCGTQSAADATWLGMEDGGSGAGWNGGQRTVTIPADSAGATGAADWECWFFHWIQKNHNTEISEQVLSILDNTNKPIAAIKVYCTKTPSYDAYIEFWANGRKYMTKSFRAGERVWTPGATAGSYNTFHWTNGNDVIIKMGSKITFYFDNEYFDFNVPELANTKAIKIQMSFFRYGTKPVSMRNFFKTIYFTKHNANRWVDLPNRYQAGDKIYIDGESTKVYVNDMPRSNDEVVGSQYFKAKPGETKVQFFYSDFCSVAPTIKATIREAYL